MSENIYHNIFQPELTINKAIKVKEQIRKFEKQIGEQDLYHADKKLYGKFYHEFCPVLCLAQKLKCISFSLIEEDELRYDAKVKLVDGTAYHVECVTAMDHYNDSIRMEHLKKYGRAPLHDEIEYQGNKSNREITETSSQAHSTKAIRRKIKKSVCIPILESFEKKLSMQKKGIYEDTILIIVIDDNYNNRSILIEELQEPIKSIQKIKNGFIQIYICGIERLYDQECANLFIKVK